MPICRELIHCPCTEFFRLHQPAVTLSQKQVPDWSTLFAPCTTCHFLRRQSPAVSVLCGTILSSVF